MRRPIISAGPIVIPEGVRPGRPDDHPFLYRSIGNRFEARGGPAGVTIALYDVIGFGGVTSTQLRAELVKAPNAPIRLRVNSPGGDVFEGMAMFNDLAAHPGGVTVEVVGLAASAASLVAMAGREIRIAPNAFVMIHNAHTYAGGTAADLRSVADVLAGIDATLAETYAARTKRPRDEIVRMLDAETWMGATDAVSNGFADGVLDTSSEDGPRAAFDVSGFRNAPPSLRSEARALLDAREAPDDLAALSAIVDTIRNSNRTNAR